jgi:hypothetical protein
LSFSKCSLNKGDFIFRSKSCSRSSGMTIVLGTLGDSLFDPLGERHGLQERGKCFVREPPEFS